MTLEELKVRVDRCYNERTKDLIVCIPNNKAGFGYLPATGVTGAGKGMDWNNSKFFIWPEVDMVEQKKFKEENESSI